MRGIGRFLVMDRPKPAMTDTARPTHGPQSGAVLAAQGPVGISGIAGRSFLHRHPPGGYLQEPPRQHTDRREREKDV